MHAQKRVMRMLAARLVLCSLCLPAAAYRLGAPQVAARRRTAAPPRCATAAVATEVEYGGIPYVGVVVGSAEEARKFYTEVLGMADVTGSRPLDVPGARVRVGAQTIELMEVPSPDPVNVDPSYSMSAPPPGYRAKGRPVHAGRDRHVAITLHDLGPLKASLEANGVNYTMSYSGRQALFCRDPYGNGWEFGPPATYQNATRLFPPYLAARGPEADRPIGWGGMPHVGLLVSSTPAARRFYCAVLRMVDESDLRPLKLPFPGLFLRCGEQQVHLLELPNPDPDEAAQRPAPARDRCTAFTVKSLAPVAAALAAEGVEHSAAERATGEAVLYCRDPDANVLAFVEDPAVQPIAEAFDGPMVPWTRLW